VRGPELLAGLNGSLDFCLDLGLCSRKGCDWIGHFTSAHQGIHLVRDER
jgi:hypothetical protein